MNFLKKWLSPSTIIIHDPANDYREVEILAKDFKQITATNKMNSDIRQINGSRYKYPQASAEIFDSIYGHDDLKVLFRNAIENEDQIHILLTGAAGTAKSLFLEAIAHNVRHAYYIDNNSTGAGIIKYLYEHPDLRILCIDEIEKLRKDEVAVLLNLMESGMLHINKATLRCDRRQKISIFATSNNKYKMAPEMLSRFLKLHLKPYTFPEFTMITTNLAIKKFHKDADFADKVATVVWNDMGSRDVRDCLKIMKLCKDSSQIDVIARTLKSYSEEEAETEE